MEAEDAKREIDRLMKEAERPKKIAEEDQQEMEVRIDALKREKLMCMKYELQKYENIGSLGGTGIWSGIT